MGMLFILYMHIYALIKLNNYILHITISFHTFPLSCFENEY